MPRRVSTAQVDSTASCRLHVDTTLATRDYSNEALRKRFTCVVAYPFVRRDSRTSVAHPLARPSDRLRRGSLRKAFAFLRCISARPAFLTVCRLLYSADSFHSASPAEFCSAYMSPDFPARRHHDTVRKGSAAARAAPPPTRQARLRPPQSPTTLTYY